MASRHCVALQRKGKGTARSVRSTQVDRVTGHNATELAGVGIEYSGAPLLWTPWGPGEVSCI